MSEQDYASKDLKRRPFRSTLILISMTTVVATTTFLFLFGNVLLDVTSFVTSGDTTASLGVFFETFIWATILLVLVLGVVVVSSTVSLEMVTRRKDIGLMKSIGTLMDTIFDHFMAQALIMLGSSVVLGIALGTFLYVLGLLWLSSVVANLVITSSFPWLHVVGLSAIYLVVGYFAAQRPIYNIVHESPIDALNPDIGTKVQKVGYLDTFGLPFRIATKATGRRLTGSRRTLLSLFLSISLASLLWIGGGVVEATTDAYVIRSMGSDVVAVGDADLLNQYYAAYSLTGTKLDSSFDFMNESYMVPTDLIMELTGLAGIGDLDRRLLSYETVGEGPAIIWNPTLEQYEYIGLNRSGSALIVGIDWSSTISDWYYEGAQVNASSQVWIGGQMANVLYEDPLVQSLEVQGASLDVQAVAFDILNGGDVAYMSIDQMQSLFGVTGANLILVQVGRYDQSVIDQITDLADDYGMAVYLQQEVLEENLHTVSAFWMLLQPLPVMALLSAFLSLVNYLLVSVFGRLRDYVIMRSVGAGPMFIAKTMMAEGIDMGLKSGIPAVLVATFSSIYFLIPEAAVPSLLYLPMAIATTLAALLVVVALAAIPVYLIFNSKAELRVSEFSV
jgi:ABC-type antimicrobial peptide transport system permease subunit